MAHPANPQQLLLVKDLFQDAQQAALREETFSTARAILFMDLAIEQVMRAIIFALNPSFTYANDPKWYDLWREADKALKGIGLALPNYYPLENLHKDRNRVQHSGATYHFTHARGFLPAVEDTLAYVFKEVFGHELHRFNQLELIANDDLRRWLKESEVFLDGGRPEVCIAGCHYAHRFVVNAARAYTLYHGHSLSRTMSLRGLDARAAASLAETLKEITEKIDETVSLLEEEVVAIGVGLPVMEMRRFRAASRMVAKTMYADGHVEVRKGMLPAPAEEYEKAGAFMLDYISRLTRLIEAGYPGALSEIKIERHLSEMTFGD